MNGSSGKNRNLEEIRGEIGIVEINIAVAKFSTSKPPRNTPRLWALPPFAVMTLFVWYAAAQQVQTNLLTTEQAIKIASELGVNMRERDVTAFVERKGLKCQLVRVGGSDNWSNFCSLSNKCILELNFRDNGLFQKWEYGLLEGAFIQSNGVRITTINLTNSVLP